MPGGAGYVRMEAGNLLWIQILHIIIGKDAAAEPGADHRDDGQVTCRVSKRTCGVIPASEKIRFTMERMVELLSISTKGS